MSTLKIKYLKQSYQKRNHTPYPTLNLSYTLPSYPTPYPILSLPYPLPYPTLLYPTLPYPTLPSTLPYPILPYPLP